MNYAPEVIFTVYMLSILVLVRIIFSTIMLLHYFRLVSINSHDVKYSRAERAWGFAIFFQLKLMMMQIYLLWFTASPWKIPLILIIAMQIPVAIIGSDNARKQIEDRSFRLDKTFLLLQAFELLLFVAFLLFFYSR